MEEKDRKFKKFRQIMAIIGIVLLISMYIVSFIVALCTDASTFGIFMTCLVTTIFVPIIIFMAMELYKLVYKNRKENVSVRELKKMSKKYENNPEGMISELEEKGKKSEK